MVSVHPTPTKGGRGARVDVEHLFGGESEDWPQVSGGCRESGTRHLDQGGVLFSAWTLMKGVDRDMQLVRDCRDAAISPRGTDPNYHVGQVADAPLLHKVAEAGASAFLRAVCPVGKDKDGYLSSHGAPFERWLVNEKFQLSNTTLPHYITVCTTEEFQVLVK